MFCQYCRRYCQCGEFEDGMDAFDCKSLHMGLNKHRLNGKYSDVSVRVDEKVFQCHRVVLASACEFFDSMFGGNFKEGSHENAAITLIDIDANSFEIILEFIYLGREPILSQDNIYGLLRSSDFLRLQKIKNMSVEYILKNASLFSSTNAFEIFHLACGMNDQLMMDTLGKRIALFLQDFVREDFFVEMAYDCLSLVLQTYRSSCVHFSSENFLLDAIVRWVFHDYKERRKFFQKLMETIDFDRITADCVEFWLKECKIDHTMLKETRNGAALKAFILNALLSNCNFAINDDALPVSFQDPPSNISPSVYIYIQLNGSSSKRNMYNVFSLNEPHTSSEIEAEKSLLSHSSSNNYVSKSEWVISSTFSLKSQLYANLTLVTQDKPNRIYCFYKDKFCAYSSINLSSNEYTNLKVPTHSVTYSKVCATNNGYIYVHHIYGDHNIEGYNCTTNEWFEIPKLAEEVSKFDFVADNNFLYLIGGVNSNGSVCNEGIRVYDCRTPRWMCWSTGSKMKKRSSWLSSYSLSSDYYKAPQSCLKDGNIYVYDGKAFRVFDVTARKWKDMELETISKDGWFPDSRWANSCPSDHRMICYGNKLLLFNTIFPYYLICDYKTEIYEEHTLFDDSYCKTGDFRIENVIAFNSLEM